MQPAPRQMVPVEFNQGWGFLFAAFHGLGTAFAEITAAGQVQKPGYYAGNGGQDAVLRNRPVQVGHGMHQAHRVGVFGIVEKLLSLNPNDARALYMGANGLVGLGQNTRAIEWLDKARDLEEWLGAMRMQALPSINHVYADRHGNVGYFYNARFPRRAASRVSATPYTPPPTISRSYGRAAASAGSRRITPSIAAASRGRPGGPTARGCGSSFRRGARS